MQHTVHNQEKRRGGNENSENEDDNNDATMLLPQHRLNDISNEWNTFKTTFEPEEHLSDCDEEKIDEESYGKYLFWISIFNLYQRTEMKKFVENKNMKNVKAPDLPDKFRNEALTKKQHSGQCK